MQKYFEKIPGERLFLSPMHPDDDALITKWFNDPAVAIGLDAYAPMFALLRANETSERRANTQTYAIVLREDERCIGYVELMEINQKDGKATMGLCIGEESDRGRGYGPEAARLLLGYAFATLRLHSVQAVVYASNAPSLACCEKIGFKTTGRRRESAFQNGTFVDEVQMDILAREFLAR